MPYHIETESHGHNFPRGTGIVVNTHSGRHYSNKPIPMARAHAQLRLLEASEHGAPIRAGKAPMAPAVRPAFLKRFKRKM